MRLKSVFFTAVFIACLPLSLSAEARDKGTPAPTNWGYVPSGPVDVLPKISRRKGNIVHLLRGALVPVLEVKEKGAGRWARVRVVAPATLTPQYGWVESSQLEIRPLEQFPDDADLLKILGGPYLDDFTATNTAIARFVARQAGQEPAVVCLLGSPVLHNARLQVFVRLQGKLVPGPFRDFPFADMQGGITSLEVRDLLGDGNECLITREPFSLGPESRGVNMVIQRLDGGVLKTLWKAPLEFRNLGSFPPQRQLLEPLERNIGSAGTVTTGTVEFRSRGRVSEPVWIGKVEFFVFGRAQPVETLTIEKICPWDGAKFASLQ